MTTVSRPSAPPEAFSQESNREVQPCPNTPVASKRLSYVRVRAVVAIRGRASVSAYLMFPVVTRIGAPTHASGEPFSIASAGLMLFSPSGQEQSISRAGSVASWKSRNGNGVGPLVQVVAVARIISLPGGAGIQGTIHGPQPGLESEMQETKPSMIVAPGVVNEGSHSNLRCRLPGNGKLYET